MKWQYLVLFQLCGLLSFAQNSGSSCTVKIFLNDLNEIQIETIPAVSKDESLIAVNYQKYSCCLGYESELLFLSVKRGDPLQRLVMIPHSDSTVHTNAKKLELMEAANWIFQVEEFCPMRPVDSFKVVNVFHTSKYLFLNLDGIKFRTRNFKLPKLRIPDYCCANRRLGDVRGCKIHPNFFRVWMSESRDFLLLEYGIIHQANGCDNGPNFRIIRLRRGRT
jgi:hypothetical protein